MNLNITSFVSSLKSYLDECFKDYNGLSYKTSDNPDEGLNISSPSIYEYLMPSSEIVDNYPSKSPCIVITVDERTLNTYTITLHLCVRYDSISEKEKVHRINNSDIYEYLSEDGYTTSSDIELYKSSLLFNEHVYKLISINTELGITDIQSELPSVDLDEFPYSISTITFKINVNQFNIGLDNANEYY